MRIGVGYPFELSAPRARDFVAMVDGSGADSVWVYENPTWPGAFSTAGAVAAATEHVRVGIGTVSPFTRNPVVLAMEIAQLQQLAEGRAVVALGAGAPQTLQRWGIDATGPLRVMSETLEVLRGLLAGDVVDFAGEAVRVNQVRLSFPPEVPVPLYFGTIGPRLVARAGRLADGLIISNHAPLPLLRARVESAHGAAAEVGRPADSVQVVAFVPYSMRSAGSEAYDALKPSLATTLARIAGNTALEAMYTSSGLLDAEEIAQVARGLGEGASPRDLVRDEVVDELCLAGDPDRVAARVGDYAEAGVDELVLFELGTDPDPERSLRHLLQLVGSHAG